MKVKEFRGGYDNNFAYLVWNEKGGVLIDASITSKRILKFVEENDIDLKAVFVMHSHDDHLVDLNVYSGMGVKIIKNVKDDVMDLIGLKFTVIFTPGHMDDSICVLVNRKLFTSDTLFVGAIGRCDLKGSDAIDYYDSLYNKLLKLDDDIEVYPGHDYGKKRISTMGEEKENNRFLKCKSRDEFLQLVGFY